MLNTIESAIEDIRNGKMVIVVDDEDRENEGDFIVAADCVTPETINFMSPQIQNARLSPRALSTGLATGGRGFRRKGRNPSGM